ncbi:MAG: hypothetical protein AN483_18600 [Aphanizomenon flos-aquae MDT14a]|jgi:predicted KAP-like P-loop ATPase|nr:MAG: hypothetical protein AN483_18600 [Aphanizomenon flos-aquae MDT14a]
MAAPQNLEAVTPILESYLTEFKSWVFSVAISPQGREWVAVGLKNGTIEIWNLLTKTRFLSSEGLEGHRGAIWSVAFNHNGTQLVSGGSDQTVRLWDVTKTTIISVSSPLWIHEDFVKSVAFNHNSTQVVSGSDDKTVRLWDATRLQIIAFQSLFHKDFVKSVAFNYDGSMLVSGGRDNMVRLWDVKTGQAINRPLWVHDDFIRSVAFSPDGSMVMSGSRDKTVKLWNVATGQAIGEPFYHTDDVRSVAFSLDGSMFVSGSSDNKVRLWDISDPGHQQQIIIGEHENPVYSVAFDPQEEDIIISASTDGIKVWRLNVHRVAQAFSNDKANGKDTLGIKKELESLADVLMLRSLEPPLAMAILGSWGSGKSFGMNLIEKRITAIRCQKLNGEKTWGNTGKEKDLSVFVGHVYQIKFNAWSYAKSNLWASLMQTIFEQLDRQLTLEKQLGEVSNLLDGGEVWKALNQMSDSDRNAILESELAPEVFAKLEDGNNALWDILSKVRKEEQEKLKKSESELDILEIEVRSKNEEIEKKVTQEFENKSRIIIFLTQFKELRKADFGDSILKDFLNDYGFKNQQDLENRFPIFKDLDKLQESDLVEKIQDLIKNPNSEIENTIENIIKQSEKIKNFVEEQPSEIVGLIEIIQKDKSTLYRFLLVISLPFISYFLIVNVLPTVLPWLTTVSTIPAIGFGIEILRKSRNFQRRVSRLFQVAKESIEKEKQKLAADKDKKIQSEIDRQNSEQQRKIEKLKDQIQRQKQRIGLTGKYKSLLDFVNTRLDDNSYQKLLGLMHQIQDDLADLSDHLTYKPEKINNPDKLEVLKVHFPRGPARIVLYIDDLDRCPPDKVVEVLEAVQLLLNTEIFIIVLAIDDRYIGRALEQVYEGVLKRGATPSGIDYLEKIIQIPYRMRPINKDMTEKFLRSLIDIEDKPQEDQPQKEKITIWEDNSEKGNMELSTYSDKISEPINEENYNKENDSEKTPSSENQTSLVDFQKVTSQKFTSEEVQWISECCKCVDLNPRTTKRLINICKILKNIWTPGPNDRIWKEEPEEKYKRTLIAFLALAGRYPQEMRKLLEEIYLEFEETNINTVKIIKYKWLNRLQNLDPLMDTHNQREWKKFKNDLNKMPPQEFVFDKRTFNLAVSFCFVGDLGYDPDDTYNREYKFEDPQKQYGFKRI